MKFKLFSILWHIALLGCIIGMTCSGQIISVATTNSSSTVNEIKYIRGLLAIDQKQTSCELVPLGQNAAFVAASCINQGQNHTFTAYMFDKHIPASRSTLKFDSSVVRMHSQYNETTMANNIAIIQFSNPSVITVDSQMTMYDPALSLIQYSQITLERSMRQWDKVYATQFEAPVSQGCADYSAVYAQNPNLFVCTTARGSFSTANYKVPYGVATVEDAAKEKYVYALYSHSVMDNATLDGAQNVYSYYTVLSNYAAFAHSILGIDVKFLSNNAFQSVQIQTDPQVNVDITSGAAGTKDGVLVSGNLYSRDDEQKPAIVEITMETPDVSTENQSEENGSTDTTENATAEKNNAKKKKGLSTGAIVGIAIGASLMGLLAIIIGIRYAREVARRRSAERYWEREVRNLRSAKDLSQLTETDA